MTKTRVRADTFFEALLERKLEEKGKELAVAKRETLTLQQELAVARKGLEEAATDLEGRARTIRGVLKRKKGKTR